MSALHISPLVEKSPWYAVRVRSNYEKKTAFYLRERGIEEFLPLYATRRQWSDREKVIHLPLFGGYLFSRFGQEDFYRVLNAPGVVHLVGVGRMPLAVDEKEMEAVRKMVSSGAPIGPWPFMKAGQRVRIRSGSMKNLEGVLLQIKNQFRLVATVTLLNRSVAMEIDRDLVEPIL